MEAAQILDRVVARFIGTKHERDIKKLMPVIAAINAREAEVLSLFRKADGFDGLCAFRNTFSGEMR